MKLHPSITFDRLEEACERQIQTLDNPGFCISCGTETEGVEPDARNYTCDHCEKPTVFGAFELLFEVL